MDSHNNVNFFMLRQEKHIVLIVIHNIDALVSYEKLFLPPFSLKMKVYPLKDIKMDYHNKVNSIRAWATTTYSTH